MSVKYAEAGNRGGDVRSDCWIGLRLTGSGGIQLNFKSKVDVLYGESSRELIRGMLQFFEIKHAEVEIEDAGAVPYVIMARVETAVRRLQVDKGKRYLPGWQYPVPPSARDRFRRSRLYLPGDQPKLSLNAAIHKPDGIILDLEDSVAPANKDAARVLVRNALRSMDFMGAERMVRINQLPLGFADLEEIVPQEPHLILIPKVETPEQVREIEKKVEEILTGKENAEIKQEFFGGNFPQNKMENWDRRTASSSFGADSKKPPLPRSGSEDGCAAPRRRQENDLFFMPIIESGLGVINAYAIAKASTRSVALAIGLEDYTADIGVQRTNQGKESFFARSMLVNAARAAGIQAIDTVFSDVSDMDALRESVLEAKALGFDGKGAIHPRQIAVIHQAFAPAAQEIEKAEKIVLAFEEAEKKGLGVVSLGSKMIDPPVVKRALKTITMAVKEGKLPEDWRTGNE